MFYTFNNIFMVSVRKDVPISFYALYADMGTLCHFSPITLSCSVFIRDFVIGNN